MNKRLAVTEDGHMSFCTSSEENMGKGRCNHVAHQYDGESIRDFSERIEKTDLAKATVVKDFVDMAPDMNREEFKALFEIVREEDGKLFLDKPFDEDYESRAEDLPTSIDGEPVLILSESNPMRPYSETVYSDPRIEELFETAKNRIFSDPDDLLEYMEHTEEAHAVHPLSIAYRTSEEYLEAHKLIKEYNITANVMYCGPKR